MKRHRIAGAVLALAGFGGVLGVPAVATAGSPPPTLTDIRAAHHKGFDRLVFEFRGGLPTERSAKYVSTVFADPSGNVVPVAGGARLLVRFFAAVVGPKLMERTFALPGVLQAVRAGSFESVLSYGVGVAKKEPVHLSTLTNPARVVIDIPTPYRTTPLKVFFVNSRKAAKPVKAVTRPVIAASPAVGVLQRLFAGPTVAETATGLRFISSDATGFKQLTIRDRVARVHLTGGCNRHGSTVTIADEIVPALKQFGSVRWVKIYDPAGHTKRPNGHSDSIPACLQP
jgi:hypothetical protein